MGAYESRSVSPKEVKQIVELIRGGCSIHKPNPQIATVLILQNNLGCRIGGIMKLRTDSFINDCGIWKIDIIEEKTKKRRTFIVAPQVMKFVQKWIKTADIKPGEPLFSIKAPAVWKALRAATEYLDMDHVSCHSFRKGMSASIYNKTHDIEAVREFPQHDSVITTQRYIKRSSHQLEEAILSSVTIA
jgi:integrase